MKLCDSIRQALLTLIEQDIVVASWGLSDIQVNESSIIFTVDGFKYRGSVIIIECGDSYKVIMDEYILLCDIISLVNNLDEFIERGSDYNTRIKAALGINDDIKYR